MSQLQKIKLILDHYGHDHQKLKAIEELSELIEAIQTKSHSSVLLGEIADVMVMLKQLRLIYAIKFEDVDQMMDFKIERTLNLIRAENNEKIQPEA